MPTPSIVGVKLGSAGHFIAVLEKAGSNYLVGDPVIGPQWCDEQDFWQRYAFTGFWMRVAKK